MNLRIYLNSTLELIF